MLACLHIFISLIWVVHRKKVGYPLRKVSESINIKKSCERSYANEKTGFFCVTRYFAVLDGFS